MAALNNSIENNPHTGLALSSLALFNLNVNDNKPSINANHPFLKMYRSDSRINSNKEQETPFAAYSDCEDLLEKLKILNYEAEFLSEIKMRPLHK